MDRSADEQRSLLEMEWINHALPHSRTWRTYERTQKEHLYQKKLFVVWDLISGAPQVHDLLRVGEIGVSWEGGLTVLLKSGRFDREYTVTSRPREEIPGVFLWLPAFIDARHAPMKYEVPGSVRRLTLPMNIRTARAALCNDARYVSTLKSFQAAWPGII